MELLIFEHFLRLNGQSRIDEDTWHKAKCETQNYLTRSFHLPLLNNLLQCFENSHPELKYVYDWHIFTQEAKLKPLQNPKINLNLVIFANAGI